MADPAEPATEAKPAAHELLGALQDEGVAALAAALRDGKAPKLEEINLFKNPASEAAKQALRDAREGLTVDYHGI